MPPRIHLIAPAGACLPFLETMKLASAAELVALVQRIVGAGYEVTGDTAVLSAEEDELHGGRIDDAARARDIESALGDSQVAAVVAIRGGAWFTRILPRIDFSVMDRRTHRVLVIGFSEITPLVNIVASHPMGVGVYGMGPAFLPYGLRRFANTHRSSAVASTLVGDALGVASPLVGDAPTAQVWMEARLSNEFEAYFRSLVAMMEGRGEPLTVTARRIRGDVSDTFEARFVGGNLTVLSTMIGSRYQASIEPTARWLLLEDFNDKLERFDRFFSHLTLAGFWDRCAGVLLGDFHNAAANLHDAVAAILEFHLPAHRNVPVLYTPEVGHVWPMAAVPINVAVSVRHFEDRTVKVECPATAVQVV